MKKEKKEKYLNSVFSIFSAFKKREVTLLSDRETHFSNTEIRLIGEVLSAKYEGKRLISTQLAKQLGVTRSAISQMVNRLEKEGVLRRVPDDVDRKIAYIEIPKETIERYQADLDEYLNFIGKVVEKFGEEKLELLHSLTDEFITIAEEMRDKNL